MAILLGGVKQVQDSNFVTDWVFIIKRLAAWVSTSDVKLIILPLVGDQAAAVCWLQHLPAFRLPGVSFSFIASCRIASRQGVLKLTPGSVKLNM